MTGGWVPHRRSVPAVLFDAEPAPIWDELVAEVGDPQLASDDAAVLIARLDVEIARVAGDEPVLASTKAWIGLIAAIADPAQGVAS